MKILVIANDTFSLYKLRYDMLKSFISKGCEVHAVGPDDDYANKINAIGVHYTKIDYARTGIDPLADISLYKRYKNYIKDYCPDIVFTYNLKPNIYGVLAANRLGHKRIYVMIPGAGYIFSGVSLKSYIIRFLIYPLYRYSLRKAMSIFFQNPDDREEFLKIKLVKRQQCVQVFGSGVNMEEFPFEEQPAQVAFIFLARLLKVKGILEYCQAAAETRKSYPGACFHVVGGMDENPTSISTCELDSFIRNGDIIYHGKVDDVRPYLRQASVMVLPSYHREGVPHSVLEAMSMGRTIITTNNIGCRETVRNGINGLFVNARDPKDLEEKMIWMLKNPQAVAKMGEESYKFCKEKFDVQIVNQTILKTMGL